MCATGSASAIILETFDRKRALAEPVAHESERLQVSVSFRYGRDFSKTPPIKSRNNQRNSR